MDYSRLLAIGERARARGKLAPEDVAFIRQDVPEALAAFPKIKPPAKLDHPGGFRVAGAPVGTFVKGALVMAGERALGRRFAGHEFYERVETELALAVMRSHFHHGYPKGTHCCAACTLAVLPVLEMSAIRYFDCRPLAKDVRKLIVERRWRFASPVSAKMLSWSLGTVE